jgi:hypothetical protein
MMGKEVYPKNQITYLALFKAISVFQHKLSLVVETRFFGPQTCNFILYLKPSCITSFNNNRQGIPPLYGIYYGGLCVTVGYINRKVIVVLISKTLISVGIMIFDKGTTGIHRYSFMI